MRSRSLSLYIYPLLNPILVLSNSCPDILCSDDPVAAMLETCIPAFMSQVLLISFILLSFVKNGRAGITSPYVRPEWSAEDIPLDNIVFALQEGYNVPQQVHITQGDYDGKAVIISWVTTEEPGNSIVIYGRRDGRYLLAQGTVTNYTFYEYQSGYIHHCVVDGLEYDTKYYYKIGDHVREFSFQTPPEIGPDAPYTFGIIGDLGQTNNSVSTLAHYMRSGGEAVLFVGDLSYADRYQNNTIGLRWDSWGRLVEKSTAYQPWMWSVGNHDIEWMPWLGEVVPFKSYLHRYATPYLASDSTNPLWYAVRRASAHIIVLSSYSSFVAFSPQYFWLLGEFGKVNRKETPWLIVVMHVPIYNSNDAHFLEGESIRITFERMFVENKVDLVLSGHVHAYERSYRVSNLNYNVQNGLPYPIPDASAPVYINIGDGGNSEGLSANFSDPQPDYSAFREASYGHSTLEIKNRTHAFYHWHRNDNGIPFVADSAVFLNQYWTKN